MRYLDDLTPVQRYLALKAEMERLKDDLEELKPLLTAALMEEPEGTFEYAGFRFELGAAGRTRIARRCRCWRRSYGHGRRRRKGPALLN
jgi:hypothetical protein